MRLVIIFMTIIINFIFQSTIVHYLRIFEVLPNTGLILVVTFGLLGGKKTGSFVGFIIGILHDIFFCNVIGVYGLIYFLIGYFIGSINQKLFKENSIIPFLFTIFATVGFHFTYYIFMYFLGISTNFMFILRRIVIIEAIYNGIISVFIYSQIRKLYKEPQLKFRR